MVLNSADFASVRSTRVVDSNEVSDNGDRAQDEDTVQVILSVPRQVSTYPLD